jgi:nucleoside-diphosphate-sugar epimerase
MTVLITGATGRIGRHTVHGYLADGRRVRALVLPGDPGGAALETAGVEVVVGALTDRAALARATRDVAIVCHLAAALTSRGHADDDFFASNLHGTYELLQAVRARAPALRRLVYVSSDAVYWSGLLAPADYLPVDELHPRRPGSVYGATKLGAEELCLTFQRAYGVPVAIMRPTATADAAELLEREGPFGRRLFVRGMIGFLERQDSLDEAGRVMLEALRGIDDGRERLYVVADADGRASTSTLNDARDAAEGLRIIAAADASLGEAFNVGPAAGYAERELAERLGERLGLPVSTIHTPFARPDWVVSSAKAMTMLGYAPARTVFDMLDEAIESHAATALTAGRSDR